MPNIVFPILLVLLGLFVGIISMIILISIKNIAAARKATEILEETKKED